MHESDSNESMKVHRTWLLTLQEEQEQLEQLPLQQLQEQGDILMELESFERFLEVVL